MRIWLQAMVNFAELPAYRAAAQRHYRKAARPDTEFVLHGTLPGTYSNDYPISDLKYPALGFMHYGQNMGAAVAAERQGYDAFAMCYLSGSYRNEIRSVVDIPVVSYAEAACHFAMLYGERFGILKFAPEQGDKISSVVADIGLEKHFAGVAYSGSSHRDIFDNFTNPQPIIDRFKETVRKFAQDTGADVIIPGEMPNNVFLASHGVHRVDDIPIIDGAAVTLKLTELMVDLQNTFGLSLSRHGRRSWRPPKERLDQVIKFYGLDKAWGAIADPNRKQD